MILRKLLLILQIFISSFALGATAALRWSEANPPAPPPTRFSAFEFGTSLPAPDLFTRDGWPAFADDLDAPLVMRWGCDAPGLWNEKAGITGPCEYSQHRI